MPHCLSRRHFNAGLLAGAALVPLAGCGSINPATGRRSFTGFYSIEDDIRLGGEEHPKMVKAFGGVYEEGRLGTYVDQIGQRLAADTEFQQFRYTFTVLNSPIVNAFALPGGYVYVSRGLLALASNEAELAGVLAHEIGHVTARHTAERLSAARLAQLGVLAGAIGTSALGLPSELAQVGQSIAVAAVQSYSRQQELESDMLGVRYMTRRGYDPEAMATFLETLREHSMVEARMLGLAPGSVDEFNIMATHPRTIDRVREAQAAAAAQRPAETQTGRGPYLDHIHGMMFGDDPEQGVVRGQTFLHPGLRFAFDVPPDFVLRNRPDRVIAQDSAGAAIVFDMAPIRRAGAMTTYIQAEWAGKVRLSGVETLRIDGREAATGWVRGRSNAGEVVVRLLAIRRDATSAYRFIYVSPAARTEALSEPLRRSSFSFRTLSETEARNVRAARLLVVKATAGDTVARLARSLPFGRFNEDWFRVLNDIPPSGAIDPSERLKVVAI